MNLHPEMACVAGRAEPIEAWPGCNTITHKVIADRSIDRF